jgi:sulfur carrier protein ThiS
MNIEVKFNCKDIMGDFREGAYDFPEGITIEGFMQTIHEEAGKTLTEGIRNSLVFMVNSRPAQWSTVLNDGDKVRVLYKILGG